MYCGAAGVRSFGPDVADWYINMESAHSVCHHSGYKREYTESSSFFNLLYIYTEKERALHHS